MLGLIKKDLLLLKGNVKLFIIIFFICITISLTGEFNITFFLPFITIMLFISTFNYDDYNNWNAYAVTLPQGRKSIVKCKYISGIILTLLSMIVGLIIYLLQICSINSFSLSKIGTSLVGGIIAIVLIISIMLPLIFKFGIEKGRILLFVLVTCFSIFISLLSNIIDFNKLLNVFYFIDNIWYVITPVLIILSLGISYFISNKIYLNKEF